MARLSILAQNTVRRLRGLNAINEPHLDYLAALLKGLDLNVKSFTYDMTCRTDYKLIPRTKLRGWWIPAGSGRDFVSGRSSVIPLSVRKDVLTNHELQ